MSTYQQAAHKVLDYLITRTTINAKPSKSTVRIPYKELMESIGQTTTKQVDLVINIELSWDEPLKEKD